MRYLNMAFFCYIVDFRRTVSDIKMKMARLRLGKSIAIFCFISYLVYFKPLFFNDLEVSWSRLKH